MKNLQMKSNWINWRIIIPAILMILPVVWFFYALLIRRFLSGKGNCQFDFNFPVQYIAV